ncbi:hypothetical protein ACJQWK_03929 [Exserohilum turcicum]
MKVQTLADSTYGLIFEATPQNIQEECHSATPSGSGRLYTQFPFRFEKFYRPQNEARSSIYFVSVRRAGMNWHLSESPPLDILEGVDLPLVAWPDKGSFMLGEHGILLSTGGTGNKNAIPFHKELIYLEVNWVKGTKATKATKFGYKTWTGEPQSFSASHDGLFAMFLQSEDSGACFSHDSLFIVSLVNPEHSQIVHLFQAQKEGDCSPWNPRILSTLWSSQSSSTLYAIVDEKGAMSVWKITLSQNHGSMDWKGLCLPVVSNGCTSSIFPLTGPEGEERILVARSTFKRTGILEVATLGPDGQIHVQSITEHSVPSSSATHEEIIFQGAVTTVSAFVHKPGNFDPKKKYPLIVILHGGPNDAWRDCWPKVWNPLLWTDQGYMVITPNISGSTGYGLPFACSIYQNWGNATLKDVECLFSYMETCMPFVDLSRVVGAGYSFGGYMMNWIAGHAVSARFCALIVHAGVYSIRNLMGGDLPIIFKADFGCFPWEDAEQWEKWDPSRLCQHWKTPMMFSHGDVDYRVPITESLAAYNTCHIRGVPCQFLVFPNEGHTISRPENLAQFQKAMVDWAKQWMEGGRKIE